MPPGVAGFAPQLSLNYSSSEPNSRSNATSPAESVGDGWSLSLGSITADVYPTGSASANTWYFISGVDNVSDRLVQDSNLPSKFNTTGTFYDTQHLSYLLVQQVNNSQTNQICFHVWDRSSTYYEFGCTTDSLQYSTDTSGVRHNYRWDVNKIVAPNQGSSSNNYYKVIDVTYQRDTVTSGSYTTIRDSGIQQIVYGDEKGGTTPPLTDVAGTVDFTYQAPPYTSFNCEFPPTDTNLRCDDPLNYGSSTAPTVMSTLTLQSITSYVGKDGTGSKPAYGYNFTYNDSPATTSQCTDPGTGVQRYCAGEHLLTQIQPIVYQQGTANNLPIMWFFYNLLTNTYYDPAHYSYGQINGQSAPGSISTSWDYLTSYIDSNSGIGETIQYGTAYNNTNGTPNRTVNGIFEDRHDPLYCFKRLV